MSEVIWKRADAHNDARNYAAVHDTIFFYRKSENINFNIQRVPLSDKTADSWYNKVDDDGRRYNLADLSSPNPRPNLTYVYKGVSPPSNGWRYSLDRMNELDELGLIIQSGKTLKIKRYLDESKGTPVSDLWTDISQVRGYAGSDVPLTYRTQKPEALLERILKTSSNEGDLVLDCFCGSGTTAAVAEKLGRRWITCDLGRFAIHTARKRLLAIPQVKPFIVQNLGKYERQQWQAAEFGGNVSRKDAKTQRDTEDQKDDQDGVEAENLSGLASLRETSLREVMRREQAYREFLLELYRAKPLSGYVWLHGVRNGRMVHVGAVDSPVSVGDIQQIAMEFRRAVGSGEDAPTQNGVDVLGWDFAFEINEVAKQQAALANLHIRFVRIPREVLEKKAVEQGDIRFFELAALSVDVQQSGRNVTLCLTDFVIPLDDVPDDVQRAVKSWEQWIDYWAVDWDNRGDTFHNEWQSYRTRKEPKLQMQIAHAYTEPGTYRIVVKVIDILGNDTTKTLQVTV